MSKIAVLEMIKQHLKSVIEGNYDIDNVLTFLLYCFKVMYKKSIKKEEKEEKKEKKEVSYFR